MADGSLLLVYRSYDTGELIALRDKIKGSYSTMSSQTVGSKSYTRDLRLLQSQLEAITFVLNERTTPYQGTILADFSQGGVPRGQPAGVNDQLSY